MRFQTYILSLTLGPDNFYYKHFSSLILWLTTFDGKINIPDLRYMKIGKPVEVTDPQARIIGAEILDMVYGYKVEPSRPDPLIDLADISAQQFSNAVQIGNWAVDSIPMCEDHFKDHLHFKLSSSTDQVWLVKYLPSWFPGAGFQRTAQKWGQVLTTLAERPYAFALHQRSKQKDTASYVSRHLDLLSGPATPDEENLIKWTAAVIYSGGADTVREIPSTFMLNNY